MVAKLNQILAIEKGMRTRNYNKIGEVHKAVQKSDLFTGHVRTYQPLEEGDTERHPDQIKRIQHKITDLLTDVAKLTTDVLDITARKDWTNCVAKADIIMDGGTVLVRNVPVTYLLFLEKQLTDLLTFVDSIVVLDATESWQPDVNDTGLFKAATTYTHLTKKKQKPVVKYPATDKHPAQTEMVTEDTIVGHWHTTKQSGAMPYSTKREMSERVTKLLQAVKEARERANSADEVPPPPIGSVFFNYIFARNP